MRCWNVGHSSGLGNIFLSPHMYSIAKEVRVADTLGMSVPSLYEVSVCDSQYVMPCRFHEFASVRRHEIVKGAVTGLL